MSTVALTAYVLMWPLIVAGVLLVICRGFIGELLKARKEGRSII